MEPHCLTAKFIKAFTTTILLVTAAVVQTPSLLAGPMYSALVDFVLAQDSEAVAVSHAYFTDADGFESDEASIDSHGNYVYEARSAAAGPFGLRASAYTVVYYPDARFGDRQYLSGTAYADLSFDDFMITGPGNAPVPASLNFHLDGAVQANVFRTNGGNDTVNGFASVRVRGSIARSNEFSGRAFVNAQIDEPTYSSYRDGILSNYSVGNESFTTPAFMLAVNTPLKLSLTLSVDAESEVEISEGDSGLSKFRIAEASSSFFNTLTFARTGPVFNLPEGYTLNSNQAQIVDNLWVGAAAPPVPEPSSLVLLGTGAFGFAVWCVRRQLKPHAKPTHDTNC